MIAKFLKQKWQRVVFYTLLGLVIVVFILAATVNAWLSPILADKLKNGIRESSDSLYTVNFSDAEVHVLQGNIVIKDASLKVDTATYRAKKKAGTAPNNLYNLQADEIKLSGIHSLKYYFSKKVDINKITLNNPVVDMSFEANKKPHQKAKDKRTLWQRMAKSLKSVRVGVIQLNNLQFRHTNHNGKKPTYNSIKEVNLRAEDLFIDSTTQHDTSRFFYCRNVSTEINNYKGTTPNRLYTYQINNIRLSARNGQIKLQGITLKPLNPSLFFTKSHSQRYSLVLDSLLINHFDYINYHRFREFKAASVTLSKGTLNVFGPPNASPDNSDKVRTFPHVIIKKIKLGLKVDTINIRKIDLFYGEHNNKSGRDGTLAFINTHGSIVNLTNDSLSLKKSNICTVHMNTSFMYSGRLDVTFHLNLTAADAAFDYKGTLGPMKLSALNTAIKPLSMVQVKSGQLNKFSFDVDANRYRAKGKIVMLYNDLKINLLKRDDDDGRLKKRGLASFFTNVMVLERNNPDEPGKAPRTANITFVRPVNYPFFKVAWKTLLAGVMECAGISAMDEKKGNAKLSEGDIKKLKEKKK